MIVDKINKMEKEIEEIKKRNRKVELDKAWETSGSRKIILFLLTFLAIGFYLQSIQIPNPWLNAIVPALGFLLSTLTLLTLPFFKNLWLKFQSKS